MASNILLIEGSRHIGYHASLRFLDAGARATFLLRSPEVFDNNYEIQKYVKSGKAQLVQGYALVVEDVRKAWAKATEEAPVDLVLYTFGSTGNAKFHLTKGFTITPIDLATKCLQNVLCEMPKPAGIPLPKVVVVSSTGVSRTSRQRVPLVHRPLYGYLMRETLRDKLGMERVIAHCAGWTWNPADGEPDVEIMGEGWKGREGLPEPGTLKDAMVVRVSLLNDGECKADASNDKPPYRAVAGPDGGYSISRKDVAHFIFQAVTKEWEKYGNKQISVSY